MKYEAVIHNASISGDESDSDLAEIAKRELPGAIQRIAKGAAEAAWKVMEKGVRASKFLTLDSGQKSSFLREQTADFAKKQDPREILAMILEKLKEERDAKMANRA